MAELSLNFAHTAFTRPRVRDKHDLLLGVEATFSLSVGGRLIYSEPMFPIVELRHFLAAWLPPRSSDFEFDSIEYDEPGLVWIRRQPSGCWRAGSIHQDELSPLELHPADVLEGCQAFIAAVDAWVRQELNLDVRTVLKA